MCLLIDIDQKADTGWEGFDYVVNRNVIDRRTTWLERYESDGTWQRAASAAVPYRRGRTAVGDSRESLRMPTDSAAVSIDFKWVDNVPVPCDVMDFYLHGDVVPEGRFKYRYSTGSE